MKPSTKKTFKYWKRVLFISLLLAILLRAFVLKSFTVSSSSMEGNILKGDRIFVNKLKYGARFPITLLSIPLLHQKLPFTKISSYLDWIQLPDFRLPKTSELKRNDLIVFNNPLEDSLPIDKRNRLLKRCIALAGDTVEIKNKQILVNNTIFKNSPNSQQNYQFSTDGEILDSSFFTALGINDYDCNQKPSLYSAVLNTQTLTELAQTDFIKNLVPVNEIKEYGDPTIFPGEGSYYWNASYFGPIVTPQAGNSVKLNAKSLPLYKRIIEVYENNTVELLGNNILINGKVQDTYTFTLNYYFVISDNIDCAEDSRYWGFIPENHIIGNASYVWFSRDTDKNIRLDRIFKKLE